MDTGRYLSAVAPRLTHMKALIDAGAVEVYRNAKRECMEAEARDRITPIRRCQEEYARCVHVPCSFS